MRRLLSACSAVVLMAGVLPGVAHAQYNGGQSQSGRQQGQQQGASGQEEAPSSRRGPRLGSLRQQANAGPCPYVKVLYDAARYVELADNRPAIANVGYAGEIEGVTAGCSYRGEDPITVQMNVLFNLGRGAQATADQRSYRYWIAVTERNTAVLAKEYFDLPVDFKGAQTASVEEERTIVIPRKDTGVSGSNFEILVGFDVTPEMATFNRDGSRFRVNAGSAPAPVAPPPAQ
ncbi:MAG TPA: Tat pathway signal sequence domain protein [Brevundimonas sp.]